jgi:GTP 3',8-cyclase
LSVGERCNYRCWYCRPQARSSHAPLSSRTIVDLVGHILDQRPINKIRLTGGEPLVRPDLVQILHDLKRLVPGATTYVTTNGARLAARVDELQREGLDGVNVSLDAAFDAPFNRATGGGDLQQVLAGLEAARAAGLTVKINTVLQRSINGDHLDALARLAARLGCELRFIELMPIGAAAQIHTHEFVSADEALAALEAKLRYLGPLGRTGTARRHRFEVEGQTTVIGFITPLSHPFCSSCNRLRLDSRGRLITCLRAGHGVDLAAAAQRGPVEARRAVARALAGARGAKTWSTTEMAAVGG